MSRNAFAKLCLLLQTYGGLEDSRHVPLSSQVAMFLSVLAHHKKNRTVKYDFIHSERTISKHFQRVLNIVLRLHPMLLIHPTPVPPNSNCLRWKWFEGCFGALDGTYIDVRVKAQDRARYRTRKGSIAINVLGVCDRDMRFIYVLAGWEVVPLIVEYFEMLLPVQLALKYVEVRFLHMSYCLVLTYIDEE
ncbi:UNVERIFIED_CONTAM: hypothetical protein Slati_2709600 [Sesamum latifolium]|uniref:DUF8040 domain-containing protein n=1 Tax=Sesamum latifolium TaxID=2727402 RepID=A0AAW2VWQ8_9LAMI